jgi:membrane peptidoglycan carboxypeptidase
VAVLLCGGVIGYADSVPLPDEPAVPQASVLYYRDGYTVLARVGVLDRTDVALAQVPVAVRRAVLAAEDRDFYTESAVSVRGLARALWSDTVGGGGQGASTITQQYVRNAYLTQDRTAARKAKEAVLAFKVQDRYPKDEILRRYLNTVYFGRGAYGIQAAAEAYFGVTVERLTLEQGAVLAALIKDPWGFDPAVNPQAAGDRYHWIVSAMVALGWADDRALDPARYPAVADRSPAAQAAAGPLGLVVDAVESELAGQGLSRQVLHTAGLHVVTTLDATAQRLAVEQVTAMLDSQPFGLHAALVAVDPATGAVRAYYGGDRGRGYFDDAAAPRPPAATFKPIVLAEALRQGISAQSRWDGSAPRLFPDRYGVPLVNPGGLQCADCTLARAMVLGLNTTFYAVAQRVGPARVRVLANALGIPARYGTTPTLVDRKGDPAPGRTRADISLGRYPVAPADLASGYATLAAGGVRTERHFVDRVERDGKPWYTTAALSRRVLPAAVAADVTHVLTAVLDARGPVPGRPAAGMTGSQRYLDTADVQDAWMAGYTPQLAAVVWLGRPKPAPIRDIVGNPIEGDGLPLTLWRQFVATALAAVPVAGFPPPADLGRTDVGDAKPWVDHIRPGTRSPAPTAGPGAGGPAGRQSPQPSAPPDGRAASPAPSAKPPAAQLVGAAASQRSSAAQLVGAAASQRSSAAQLVGAAASQRSSASVAPTVRPPLAHPPRVVSARRPV